MFTWITRISDKTRNKGVVGGEGSSLYLRGDQFLLSVRGQGQIGVMLLNLLGVEHHVGLPYILSLFFSQITSVTLILHAR